ncbi:MAG: Asp-tRNA(Asn)/Glu-tRNA(Gln) amidotransferase subunit GatC [Veillonella parvula]|nr:Asp-tRNA(Asn)/Glu-tRNA(Gln) amidotransferase subunit GatC [Veillonella parvula]
MKISQEEIKKIALLSRLEVKDNVFREDEKKPSLDHDLALSNAPEAEDGYFKVPRVVQE